MEKISSKHDGEQIIESRRFTTVIWREGEDRLCIVNLIASQKATILWKFHLNTKQKPDEEFLQECGLIYLNKSSIQKELSWIFLSKYYKERIK